MHRHRGFFFGLALTALLGLTGNQAQAGLITVTVSISGVVIESVTSVSATSFTVNSAVLDSKLLTAGSIYTFSGLSVTSNNPGGSPAAFLQTTAQVSEVAGTNTEPVVITVTQGGFLTPSGAGGVLASSAVGNISPGSGGSSSYVSDYNAITAPAIMQSGTVSSGTSSVPVGTVSSALGYSLSNTLSIGFTGTGSSQGITGTASLTTSAIPEPSSVVLFMTGMPLPLALVFGLIRRRRLAA